MATTLSVSSNDLSHCQLPSSLLPKLTASASLTAFLRFLSLRLCVSSSAGPYDHPNHDITRCFQSLAVLLPPSIFMLVFFFVRLTQLRRVSSSPLLLDPLPRFPQVISGSLAILALFYLGFFLLNMSNIDLYMIVQPALSFLAWSTSLLLLRFEHSRALPVHPLQRVFWLLAFIASLKQAESSVLSLALGNSVTAFDILVLLHLFLSSFMLRYAITGIGDASMPSHSWQDLEAGINDVAVGDVEEPASSVARTDRTMWKRFLNFHQNGNSHTANDDDDGMSDINHSLNSTAGGGVFSSLNARAGEADDSNPFASAAPHNPFDDKPAATSNPFAASDAASHNPFAAAHPATAASASASSSVSSKTKALRASLVDTHPLSGAAISIPSYQDSTVASRTIVQWQVSVRLGLPSLITGDDDTDTLVVYRRYREFEGLRDALQQTARKHRLGEVRELPPQPKRQAREEGRAGLEAWVAEVMTEPLYWDDVGDFVGVKDRVAYIDGYKQQLEQQRQQDERRKREEAEAIKAEEEQRERQRQRGGKSNRTTAPSNGSSQPAQSSSMQVVKVTVERPQGLDYKWQIIAVSVGGWSRWMVEEAEGEAGSAVEAGEGEPGEGEPEEGRKRGKRDNRRKGAASMPGLPAYYLTFDLPVKTTIGDYTLYKRASELVALRASLLKQFPPSSIPPLALSKGDPNDKSEEQLAHDAKAVEVFVQSLISTTTLQCNTVYAFFERRKPRDKSSHSEQHHFSGHKPAATYSLATGEWQAGEASAPPSAAVSKTVSPIGSGRSTPVAKEDDRGGVGGGRRSRRVTTKRDVAEVAGPSLFPDAVAPASPPAHDSNPSSLSTSLTSGSSPLSAANTSRTTSSTASSSSSAASHRFTVSIPSYELSDPANAKSHVLYTLIVREYFTLTSFIEWRVIRRYRDFEHTHSTLHKLFPSFPLPPLPAKRRVGKKRDGDTEERRAALEVWVQQLANVTLFQVDEFFDFLDMNNANRVFSVGTAMQAKDGPPGGLEGVGEASGEGGMDDGEGRDGEVGGMGVAVASGGGRRARSGNGGVMAGGSGTGSSGVGVGGRSVARVGRQSGRAQQSAPATTNPFD